MTEFLLVAGRASIENDFIPNVDKVFSRAVDPVTADDIRIKVAKMSGKVLDRLA
jgi:hypothetical protein